MIKVMVVVPYQELRDGAEKALREFSAPGIDYAITHLIGTQFDADEMMTADIVLARGLTQQAIKRKFKDKTVLELTVSAYDIFRAVHECRKSRSADRIAIIGSDSILYDVKTLQDMVDAAIRIFPVRNETEIMDALGEARRDGFQAIVGGLTACNLAKAAGWPTTVLPTSDETLRVSIKEAMNTALVMQNERAKAEISRTILQNSKEAVLYFDQTGILRQFNRRVYETLRLPAEDNIYGRRVGDLFNDAEIVEAVRSGRKALGLIKTVNQTLLVSDIVPVRVAEQAIGVICTFQRVHEIQETENKIRKELSKKGLIAKYGFDNIIHASPALSETIRTAHKYAGVDANVLLVGETGTGKELFAQSIHNASARRLGPFVAVNCASLPENLLESELFGYVEGAFSGAVRGGKTGLFELAHGGTLFLDEIGEIPLNLQATLLRALQEGEIRKIGDDRLIPVNVRIIAATNQDLRLKVGGGRFRMDLLYRLDVLSLVIPPLRERREDIGLIAEHYIKRYRLKYNKPGLRMSRHAWSVFTEYDWPGNTRELRNLCERLVVLGEDGAEVTREQAAGVLAVNKSLPEKTASASATDASAPTEPENIEQLVQFVNTMRMNRTDLASMLGISRTTLWRRLNKAGGGKNETQEVH